MLSTALTAEHLWDFAEMSRTELVLIDDSTSVRRFTQELRWNQAYYHLAGQCERVVDAQAGLAFAQLHLVRDDVIHFLSRHLLLKHFSKVRIVVEDELNPLADWNAMCVPPVVLVLPCVLNSIELGVSVSE